MSHLRPKICAANRQVIAGHTRLKAIYFFESPYEDDIIAQAVDDVAQSGALYFSSAGNEGHFDEGTSGTWEGDFKSGGLLATLPSGYTVHDFGAGVISNRVEAAGGPLILLWADPGSLNHPASSNDYGSLHPQRRPAGHRISPLLGVQKTGSSSLPLLASRIRLVHALILGPPV